MLELVNLGKTYYGGANPVEAVKNINLKIEDGDVFGIIGLSGAGKSTLVRCINFLERPTEGQVIFNGTDIGTLSPAGIRKCRRRMSMIFQNFNLLQQRTALGNVLFPLEVSGTPRREAEAKARKLLERVGLADREGAYPSQLSGGQQQRVAIARALATDPELLLCDEATSALDPDTTRQVLELLRGINRDTGVTMIIITHEMRVIEQICNKVAVIDSSRIAESGYVKDIFLSPQSRAAKNLILPTTDSVDSMTKGAVLRVVFDGLNASEPIISNLSLECHAAVNIVAANTRAVGGVCYGQMLLRLPEEETAAARVKSYLSSRGIHYEEADENG
ncbi:MAG: methionine ABC transporter ATP-binding protein [Eubacteriales bacterium]